MLLKQMGLCLLYFAVTQSAVSQHNVRTYAVQSGDKKVGDVRAVQRIVGEEVHYDVRSEVSISMLFTVTMAYRVTSVYSQGILQGSTAVVYLNGSVRSQVETIRRDGYYDVIEDGVIKRIDGDIRASSASLYFAKPDAREMVFSESSGALKPMSTLADGRLLLRNPQKVSDLNTYSYGAETMLKSIEIEHALFPNLLVSYVDPVVHSTH